MKRTIVLLALATAFVLAFTSLAGATWRGFTPVRTGTQLSEGLSNGFISFEEAEAEMERNFADDGAFGPDDPGAALQGTAHGGYVTTTTKCVVCHSVHRATGLEDPDLEGSIATPGTRVERNQNQAFLTAGANSCVECHVIWGSQPSRLLVEWGGPWGNDTGGGPHASPRRGCTMCHNAGIHGLTSSDFNVMNVFMLGNTRRAGEGGGQWFVDNDSTLEADDPARWTAATAAQIADPDVNLTWRAPGDGTVAAAGSAPNRGLTRDDQIRAELHLWTGPDSRDNVVMQVPGELGSNDLNTWWYNGVRSLGPVGGVPPALVDIGNIGNLTVGATYGAARSMATAYTCSEAGCHTTGAFFSTNWGVGFSRVNMVRNDGNVPADFEARIDVTGHVTPSVRVVGGINQACGPCHGGNPAGFPTASTIEGVRDDSRRAYGCDQCHDMVGVATNSTAWPHGNRNIAVYEWFDGAQVVSDASAGNLWMYAGSIARANLPGMPTGSIHNVDLPTSAEQPWSDDRRAPEFRGPNSENPVFASQDWFVMTNVTSGRYGVPSNADDTSVSNTGMGLIDGSCLKCHVALDSASLAATGQMGADALRHAWVHGGSNPLNPSWNGTIPTGSGRLFLYR